MGRQALWWAIFPVFTQQRKTYTSRNKDKQADRGFIKNRVSIDERPPIVDEKTWLGD
jgi:IS30 family transposase